MLKKSFSILRQELTLAQQNIDKKSSTITQQTKTIEILKKKTSAASESLIAIYKDKLKEESPAFWGEKPLPRRLIRRLNAARVGSFSPQLDVEASDAYDEIIDWMNKIAFEAKNDEELIAIKQIRELFDLKCGEKDALLSAITSTEVPRKEKEFDSKPSTFVSNLIDKSIRACFE